MVDALAGGRSLLVFPEGTTADDGTMLPFRNGAFRAAARTASPVVPIAIRGTRETAEQDYRFTIQDFQSFTRGGAVNAAAWGKTMELRAKSGLYNGRAIPAMGTFMDSSIVQEAQRRAGYRPSQRDRSGNVRGSADTR